MSALHLRLRRSLPPSRRRAFHTMDCRCHVCDPWKARKVEDVNHVAMRIIIGLSIGAIAAFLLDLAIGGPGFLSIFGVN